jgi:hypothetical protein
VLKVTALDEVIERIGTEVYRLGSYLLSEEELLLIYGDAVDNYERFACIREVVIDRGKGGDFQSLSVRRSCVARFRSFA